MQFTAKRLVSFIAKSSLMLLHTVSACAQISLAAHKENLQLHTPALDIQYRNQTGKLDVTWGNGQTLSGIVSSVQLQDGRTISSSSYSTHILQPLPHTPGVDTVREYVIRSSGAGLPDMLQHLWLYPRKTWFALEVELVGREVELGTRHFDPVLIQARDGSKVNGRSLRILHVPFDNDMWFRYKSVLVEDLKPAELFTSEEVTAIYDNQSRNAIVLGSITHDTWKTAIETHAEHGQISDLDVYGGISSPTGIRTDTHDTVPHGVVHGTRIKSPRVFIGSFDDWRDGLEEYGAANASIQAPLSWPTGAPMGWNSWAAYADKIDDQRYLGAATFLRDKLVPESYGDGKVLYVNLDAFWSKLDAVQLQDAVADIKSMRRKDGGRFAPGIYWTPFAYWSDDLDAYVEGTNLKYRYRDILLKAPDGSFLPKVDGGRAIDPTHPATKARAVFYLQQFEKMGFEYLKIDFLSHGALEGVHYDRAIQTGIQAYNLGMRQIVANTNGHMFLSLSIAPLFPSGYGHARRLSCDTKGHISGGDQSTEYMLNSLTYGWWTDKSLYITDPDHIVLGTKADNGARSVAEGKSRLLSAIVSGGMVLDSSRLADDPEGQELAQAVYNAPAWFKVAAKHRIFRPIEGDTDDRSTSVFSRSSEHGAYVALFNFDEKQERTETLNLERINPALRVSSPVQMVDVATGKEMASIGSSLQIKLAPSASMLVELRWK